MKITTESIKVYVAGPMFSSGRLTDNISSAVVIGNVLLDAGLAVYWPQLGAFADMIVSRDEESWLELDRSWLYECDVMLRLPGFSRGADREEEWCKEFGIPVFRNVEELLKWTREEAILG